MNLVSHSADERDAYYLQHYICSGKISSFGGIKKGLDKNWHSVDNHSAPVSAFPYKVTFLPFASPE